MTVCHVCGTENPEGTKFCEGCGVELSAAVPAASSTPVVPVETAPVVVEEVVAAAAPVAEVAAPVLAATPVVETVAPMVEAVTPVVEAVVPVVVQAVPNVAADAVNPHNTLIEEPLTPDPASTPPVIVSAVESGGAKSARLVPRDYGASTTETFPLVGDRVSVGRFDSSTGPVDIDLSGMKGEAHISRRHAEFALESGKWVIRDLGSTNGVYLKRVGQTAYGPRITQPEILNDGDEIAFGNTKFLYAESAQA
jgi:hypothetical protein